MPDHVLGDGHVVVHLAIVHLELEADEVGQDGGGARLRPDRLELLARRGPCDGETTLRSSESLLLLVMSSFHFLRVFFGGISSDIEGVFACCSHLI
jgi:hypothetical protein